MSLEKLAHDSYTQGFTETLRNMEIPDHIKIAAYKEAALLGAVTGAMGDKGALEGMGNELAGTAVGGLAGAGIGAAAGGALFGGLGADRINKLLAMDHVYNGAPLMSIKGGRGRAALVGALGAGVLGTVPGMIGGASRAYLQNLGLIE